MNQNKLFIPNRGACRQAALTLKGANYTLFNEFVSSYHTGKPLCCSTYCKCLYTSFCPSSTTIWLNCRCEWAWLKSRDVLHFWAAIPLQSQDLAMMLAARPDLQSTESKEILFHRAPLIPTGEGQRHFTLQQMVSSSANAFSSCSTYAGRTSAGKDQTGAAFPSLILPPEGKVLTPPQALQCLKRRTAYG